MESIDISDLGRAKKVTIDADNTAIIQGAGSSEVPSPDVSNKSAMKLRLRRQIMMGKSCRRGLAKLAGGVAQIFVGAATESEMKEKKARVEDALHATRAAIEEGILPGGGVALLRAAEGLNDLKLKR